MEKVPEIIEKREELCKLRLELSKDTVPIEWNMNDLDKAINKLQNNKAKDPLGHINELYKNIGLDEKIYLTKLNRVTHL